MRFHALLCWTSCLLLLACNPVNDVVFDGAAVEFALTPLRAPEGAGALQIPLRLREPAPQALRVSYRAVGVEAQDDCQLADFASTEGTLSFAAGETQKNVTLWILDDDLAELDEALSIQIEKVEGANLVGTRELHLVIEDDDRSGIVDANSEFGAGPNTATDQSAALQAAFDRAHSLGRGVVKLGPGDYEVLGVALRAGTSLSARDVRWHRPAKAPDDAVTLLLSHAGAADSSATLIEGLSIDGRRDAQGDYQAKIGENAHLIQLQGEARQAGRLRAMLEGVDVEKGTGSGVFIGPNSDVHLCRLRGTDLYRDFLTLRGGNTRLEARELVTSATLGTSGMWFSGDAEGYAGNRRIDVRISDTRLASGDLEMELEAGSNVELERFEMAQGPSRIVAPSASVRIVDSLLQFGVPSAEHNYIGLPHDVSIIRSTLVANETDDEGAAASEAKRRLSALHVHWELPSELAFGIAVATPPHRIVLDQCRFQRGSNLEADDVVFGVASSGTGGSVQVTTPTVGAGISDVLAAECSGCTLSP
ncbi:MAG: Calx-beta domain-containing protein [Myxococcota bacterium]